MGNGPYLMECETCRFHGHSMADSGTYRAALEVAELMAREPILANGWLDEDSCDRIDAEVADIVADAVCCDEGSPEPDSRSATLYA